MTYSHVTRVRAQSKVEFSRRVTGVWAFSLGLIHRYRRGGHFRESRESFLSRRRDGTRIPQTFDPRCERSCQVPYVLRQQRYRLENGTTEQRGQYRIRENQDSKLIAARMRLHILGLILLISVLVVRKASAHGRLIEPPSRASMWRYGFDTPHDYNDHECYCGGFTRQWQRNKGKCGICGDAWDTPEPRLHETGGKYGNSVIARKYRTGSVIPVRVELTANHHGYFEFRTCAMVYKGKEVDQECLDKYLLRSENGSTRYYPGPGNKIFEAFYKLPDDLTCSQCVFQWRYVAGNNWGDCGNGTGAVGCGPQEEFRSCADITIGDHVKPLPPRPPTEPPTASVPGEKSPTEPTLVPKSTGPFWLFSIVIAGTCLLVVLAAIALLYSYYYHAGRAKKWLMTSRLLAPDSPPVAPPRHKKHNTYNAPLQL